MVHGDVVIVGGKPRVITDPRMLYVRAAVQGAVVAWTGQMADGSPILVCDSQGRSWRGPTSAFGMQCVGIVPRPDGGWQVTWVVGPSRWARVDLGADLRPIAPVTERDIPRTAGGAQGFLDVELDGEPRWTDTHRMVTLDGHRLYLPLRRGDWTIGQDGEAERLLVYQHATGAVYVAHDGYTPVASRLAVDDRGQPWVLPAGSTTVVGIDQLAPWTPVYAPVVSIGRPIWMGFFEFGAESGLPANCHIPVTQGAPYLEVRGPSWAYVSGHPDGDPAAIERAIADVSGIAPVVAYVPRRAQHIIPTSAEIQGIEAYIGADESDEAFVARLTAAIRRSPRAVLIAQCYSSNHTLTPDLRRVPGLVSRLARDHALQRSR